MFPRKHDLQGELLLFDLIYIYNHKGKRPVAFDP